MTTPGQLYERITFNAETRTSDGAGGTTVGFGAIATDPTVWAAVYAIRSSEADTEGRLNAAGLYKFTIRYRDDIDETHQIIWEGEAYNIRNVKRVSSRSMYLEIEAERGVAA